VQDSKDNNSLVYDFVHKYIVLVNNQFSSSSNATFRGKMRELLKLSCRLVESIQHIASGINAFLRYVKSDIISILFGRL